MFTELAVATVLVQLSRCKEIHFEQISNLISLERTTTVFEVANHTISREQRLYSEIYNYYFEDIVALCPYSTF